MDISSLVGLIAVVALIVINGFFVAGEFALVKIRATRINQLAEEGNKTAKIIQKQLAQLRAWHIRAAICFPTTGSFMWLPAMMVVLHWLGVESWPHSPRTLYWLVSTALVCIAFSCGLVMLAKSPGSCGRALKNSWVGRTVNRAQATLDEIAQFERNGI